MYEYYVQQKCNYMNRRLHDEDKLRQYRQRRGEMLQHKLKLPLRIFAGCDVLEFGPGGGENSLIWASLGANMYLVEPVIDFHSTIRTHFNKYGCPKKLKLLAKGTLSSFVTEKLFDIVIAEGFIQATGPVWRWPRELAGFCADRGFIIVNICESTGALIEMLQRRVCLIAAQRYDRDKVEAAQIILGEKWRRINATRSFADWAWDVLYNPYANYHGLNHSGQIVKLFYNSGFDLYSSWPSLNRPMDVSWIKAPLNRRNILQEHQQAAWRLIPSMILGEPVAVKDIDDKFYKNLLHSVKNELKGLSDLTGKTTSKKIEQIITIHQKVVQALDLVVIDYKHTRLAHLMREIAMCLQRLDEKPEKLAKCFQQGVLSTNWGSPNQYFVFQKTEPT